MIGPGEPTKEEIRALIDETFEFDEIQKIFDQEKDVIRAIPGYKRLTLCVRRLYESIELKFVAIFNSCFTGNRLYLEVFDPSEFGVEEAYEFGIQKGKFFNLYDEN